MPERGLPRPSTNVLYGDYWAAANALTAVQTSCEAAFALF
ncbi:MAG: hypothetical protein KatS3mg014_2617 [Actinomycetota bacterium]|nr:MAG: hypothetical protein KatS3mg014_2617 [Actinomycetota bacterium]